MSLVMSKEEPLLDARHFKGGATRLDESGLRFDELLAHARIVLNPGSIDPSALAIEQKAYDRSWKVARNEYIHEGQDLVAVVFEADDTPAGYATFSLNVLRDDESKYITLHVNVDYFFVRPEFRSRMFGFDLAAALIWICHDVLEALYRAAPAGATIDTVLYGDRVSEGGEKIIRSIEGGLIANIDTVRDCASPQRDDVEIGKVIFDRGC